MTYNDVRKNENKGFSLVELIVVIAIMAVLTSVLAPSLLAYVERSRAQKDDSAMSEVVNAVLLGLSDQDIYDEVLFYTSYGNASCYVDETSKSTVRATADEVITKNGDGSGVTKQKQFLYDDNARLDDEQPYYFAGNMRGVTITFKPTRNTSGDMEYVLANGIINTALRSTGAGGTGAPLATHFSTTTGYVFGDPDYSTCGTFAKMSCDGGANNYLYNRTRATVGDKISLTSQTYRNSDYTIFIRMGSTGGAQTDAQDAVAVYGQWNGTNLIAEGAAGT